MIAKDEHPVSTLPPVPLMLGVAAAAANRPSELRIPPSCETREMNNRYGNVIRVSSTVRSNFTSIGRALKSTKKKGLH